MADCWRYARVSLLVATGLVILLFSSRAAGSFQSAEADVGNADHLARLRMVGLQARRRRVKRRTVGRDRSVPLAIRRSLRPGRQRRMIAYSAGSTASAPPPLGGALASLGNDSPPHRRNRTGHQTTLRTSRIRVRPVACGGQGLDRAKANISASALRVRGGRSARRISISSRSVVLVRRATIVFQPSTPYDEAVDSFRVAWVAEQRVRCAACSHQSRWVHLDIHTSATGRISSDRGAPGCTCL